MKGIVFNRKKMIETLKTAEKIGKIYDKVNQYTFVVLRKDLSIVVFNDLMQYKERNILTEYNNVDNSPQVILPINFMLQALEIFNMTDVVVYKNNRIYDIKNQELATVYDLEGKPFKDLITATKKSTEIITTMRTKDLKKVINLSIPVITSFKDFQRCILTGSKDKSYFKWIATDNARLMQKKFYMNNIETKEDFRVELSLINLKFLSNIFNEKEVPSVRLHIFDNNYVKIKYNNEEKEIFLFAKNESILEIDNIISNFLNNSKFICKLDKKRFYEELRQLKNDTEEMKDRSKVVYIIIDKKNKKLLLEGKTQTFFIEVKINPELYKEEGDTLKFRIKYRDFMDYIKYNKDSDSAYISYNFENNILGIIDNDKNISFIFFIS